MSAILDQLRTSDFGSVAEVGVEARQARVTGFTETNRVVSVDMISGTPEDVSETLAEVHDPQSITFTPEALYAYLKGSGGSVFQFAGHDVLQVPQWEGDRLVYFGKLGPYVESGSVAVETLPEVATRFESLVVFAEGSAVFPG